MANVTVSKEGKSAEKSAAVSSGTTALQPLMTLRTEVDRLFDDFFRGWPALTGFPSRFFNFDPFRRLAEPMTSLGAIVPKVDVAETADSYQIEVELPGLDEKDIEVSVSDDVLTIRGTKHAEREEKKKDYYLSERSYGSFYRAFEVPTGVESDKIAAKFAKGVLTLTLPKSPEAKSKERKIAISKS